MKISNRSIGPSFPPYIIAELSGNHNGSIQAAKELITAAASTGVDAIKLQTYTPDSITINCDRPEFLVDDKASLWHGMRLYDLYNKAQTPKEWHHELFCHAHSLGLHCFSSPFDEESVKFLETLNTPAYKIASFEITHIPLLKAVARTRKPVILSTGMASLAEIDAAVKTLRLNGSTDIALLKCTSAYPASPSDINLKTLPSLQSNFNCTVGISDHTLGIGVSLAAIALGACIVEKHITLRRSDGGVDAAFSMEPHEFQALSSEAVRAWQSIGNVVYGTQESESTSAKHRRSLYISRDLPSGHCITAADLKIVRPASGLPPSMLNCIIGMTLFTSVKKGTPASWNLFKQVKD